MKILWWGDGGCTTGFGRVTHEICSRLAKQHEVHVVAINFIEPARPPFDAVPYVLHSPVAEDPSDYYGFRLLARLINDLRPDVVVCLNDIPVIQEFMSNAGRSEDCPPFVLYTPIDCINLPSSWGELCRQVASVITYTEFGRKELSRVYDGPIAIAYHGIDHANIFPVSHAHPAQVQMFDGTIIEAYSKEEIKAAHGLDGKFIVLFCDRNSPRKWAAGFLRAAAPFVLAHDDVVIWMHCALKDEGGDISVFVDRFGLDGRVYITPNLDTFVGVSDAQMNLLYNMADVKVSTSLGEGAGLTNMEALAAGTPVICQDFSANAEMLGPEALYVPPAFYWTAPRGADYAYPDCDEYVWQLESLYSSPNKARRVAQQGIEHLKQFTWDAAVSVFEQEFERVLSNDTTPEGL